MKIKKMLRSLVLGGCLAASSYGFNTWGGDFSASTKNVEVRAQQVADSSRRSEALFNIKVDESAPFRIGSKFSMENGISFDGTKGYGIEPFIKKDFKNFGLGARYHYSSEGDSVEGKTTKAYAIDTRVNPFEGNTAGFYIKKSSMDSKEIISENEDYVFRADVNVGLDIRCMDFNYLINSDDVNLLFNWLGEDITDNVSANMVFNGDSTKSSSKTETRVDNFSLESLFKIDKENYFGLNSFYEKQTGHDESGSSLTNYFGAGGNFKKVSIGDIIFNGYGKFTSKDDKQEDSIGGTTLNFEERTDQGYVGVELFHDDDIGVNNKRVFDQASLIASNTDIIMNDLSERLERSNYLSNDGFYFNAEVSKILRGDKLRGYSYSLKGMCALHRAIRIFGGYSENAKGMRGSGKCISKDLGLLLGSERVNLELLYKRSRVNDWKNDLFGFSINYGGGLK